MHKNLIWQSFKKIGNLTFATILLLLIASYSVIGTLIEQERDIEYYKNYYPVGYKKFFQLDWILIENLQLDHIYTSWIFMLLLVILGCSLIICTFSTQLPSLRYARQWKFRKYYNSAYAYIHSRFQYKFVTYSSIIYLLIKNNYTIFQQKRYLYAHKGLVGRLAPVLVHLSLIILLLGSLITFFEGFLIQEMIPIGENFHLQNVVKAGYLSYIPKDFLGKISSFRIEYYPNKDIKQFYTNLIIIKNKHIVKRGSLSVNQPIFIDGMIFYQTDWTLNGLRIKIGEDLIQIPLQKFFSNNQNVWLSNISYDTNQKYSLVLLPVDDQISLYDNAGILLNKVNLNEDIILNHTSFKILSVIKSTGLQIKKDPGILFVYIGFCLLIISTGSSYITYSQIWIIIFPSNIYASGFTNRAEVNFEKEFMQFSKSIASI